MQHQGLVYFTTFVTPDQEAGSAWFPFPDQSLEYAQHEGYGLHALALQDANAHTTPAVGGQGAASTDPEERYELSLRGDAKSRYIHALVGPTSATFRLVGTPSGIKYPTSGCTALGEKRVYGSVANYFNVSDQLVAMGNRLATRATSSQIYKNGVASWRACMHAAGYSYADPDAGRAALANAPEQQQVSSRFQRLEIRVAVQDIKCQTDAGLRDAYSHALAAAVPSLGSKMSADVLAILATRARGVRVANKLLNDG